MPYEVDKAVLEYAEAFARVCFDKRTDLSEYRPVFNAILDRTRRADAPDLREVFDTWDDRTVRRRVEALNEILKQVAKEEGLLYSLEIELGRPGNQTVEQKRSRQTFVLHANVQLQDFYLRKWWSSVFPNKPGAMRLPVLMLYPVDEKDGRAMASVGDMQMVKHLSRSLLANGANFDDKESGEYKDDPNEADRNLILVGNEATNHVIADLTFPANLPLRCGEEGIGPVKGEIGWDEGDPSKSRTVHALVSTFKCADSEARVWIFEAQHHRALEAVARFFADAKRLETLGDELNLAPAERFPSALQLVFAVDVNKQNQLRGADGNVRLAHASEKAPPRLPMNRERLQIVQSSKLFA